MMITRSEYMKNHNLHHDYYLEIARDAGIIVPDSIMEKVRASKDVHFNDVPLRLWDMLSMGAQRALHVAAKNRGDFFSLALGVCAFKAQAKHQLND